MAECKTGTMEIVFSVKQDVEIDHYIVRGNKDIKDQHLYKFTYLTSVEDGPVNKVQTLKVIFPKKGYWTVFLLECIGCKLLYLMEYTIHASMSIINKCFPIITSNFNKYGLGILPNTIPYPSVYILPAKVEIAVYCPEFINLKAVAQCGGKELDALITQRLLANTRHVSAEISQCGEWIIKLYVVGQNFRTMELMFSHEISTTMYVAT